VVLRICGPLNWKVEDIKTRVSERKAGLFVCDGGFVVLEIDFEGVSDRKYLNVWIAYFKPNYAKEHEDELMAWLRQMKEACGCEWIQFSSPRKGWFKAKGFKPYMQIYRSYE
jgi:hypothetical protein